MCADRAAARTKTYYQYMYSTKKKVNSSNLKEETLQVHVLTIITKRFKEQINNSTVYSPEVEILLISFQVLLGLDTTCKFSLKYNV